jgi:glycosyltransferase involved in cell wall biosynthesis
MKPRLLVITQFLPPETCAAANRISAMLEALTPHFELEVIALQPSYPDPDLFTAQQARDWDSGQVYVIGRLFSFKPHDTSLFRRAWREIGMSWRLTWAAQDAAVDAVLISTPSMFLAPFAYILTKLKRAKLIWDVRDLTWRYAKESVANSAFKLRLLDVFEAVMLWIMRRTDLVISATEGLSDVIVEQGIPRERICTVANGVSKHFLDRFPNQLPTLKERPRISYVGLMGYNHGIDVLLKAARLLPELDVHFVGDGPQRMELEQMARQWNLDNVTFHGYVTDQEQLVKHYLESDVLVNHTKDTPTLNRIINPAKAFEYFASRRPIVYAGRGYAADFIKQHDLGEVVPPNDAAALARGIQATLHDPISARNRALRARQLVETQFCREEQMKALAIHLQTFLAE